MKQLCNYFSGEGNTSRNIAKAEYLKEILYYKSKRAIPFKMFLTQYEVIFNIYNKEGKKMLEDARICFLFKKVEYSDLKVTIAALKPRIINTNISYTEAVNHIVTAVSELPEYISKNRNVSGVTTGGEISNTSFSTIHKANGTIITGYIPTWCNLSKQDHDIIFAERKRLGLSKNKKGGGKNACESVNSDTLNRSKQIVEQNKKLKRQIKAFK